MPAPAPAAGTEWWARSLFTSVENYRNELPLQPLRSMVTESLFAGMMSELYGDYALGICSTSQAAAEKKVTAQRFIRRSHLGLAQLNLEKGCLICGPRCSGPRERVDLVRMAPPCQPFSRMRARKSGGPRSGDRSTEPCAVERLL